MPARFNIKMQRLILLALIPALCLITVVTGIWLYRSLYGVILEGFDRKLFALGTTTASFIDGDALLAVTEPYDVRGLAWDAENEILYGLDILRWALVTIDPETGGAEEVGPLGADGLGDIAFDPASGALYGISTTAQQLLRIDPATGGTTAVMPFTASCIGLTWDANEARLLAAGEELWALHPDQAESVLLTPLSVADITGLTYHAGESILYAIRGPEGLLVTVDIETGLVEEIGPLIPEGQAFGEVEYGEEAGELPAYALTSNPAEDILFASADRLMVLDRETGAGELDLWLSRQFCNPGSELFESFAVPMRSILEDKGVTYLYTFKMGGRKDIVYIVDATPGDDWAPIGYEEDLPPQNVEGLNRAIEEGIPFISDVLYFELWGLLKVVAAPIYDDAGNIRALTGVDINIDLIRTKTRVALFQVLGFGAISLVLAGLVSVWVTRRLIRPINLLKYGALRIAAGQYKYPLDIKNPRELRELAGALNGIGETLQTTIHEMATTSERMEMGRRRSELAKTLPNFTPETSAADQATTAARWLGSRPHCADSSGCISGKGLVLHWIGRLDEEALPALKRRSDLALSLTAWLNVAKDARSLFDQLGSIFKKEVSAFLLYDVGTGALSVLAREPIAVSKVAAGLPPEKIFVPAGTKNIQLAPGESLISLSSDPEGRWITKLEDRLPAGMADSADRLADYVENRLQSHTISELIDRTGLLTIFTRTPTP